MRGGSLIVNPLGEVLADPTSTAKPSSPRTSISTTSRAASTTSTLRAITPRPDVFHLDVNEERRQPVALNKATGTPADEPGTAAD